MPIITQCESCGVKSTPDLINWKKGGCHCCGCRFHEVYYNYNTKLELSELRYNFRKSMSKVGVGFALEDGR